MTIDEFQKQAVLAEQHYETWDTNRKDFWNDPARWDGIDPHKECFWMKRSKDVIDVRSKPPLQDKSYNPYANVAQNYYRLYAGCQQYRG